jgi:hypothetical protein
MLGPTILKITERAGNHGALCRDGGVTDRKLEIKEMFAESTLSGESDG